METVIVWFRKDLRLRDNLAWAEAVKTSARVVPLFIAPEIEGDKGRTTGAASRWWLHHALEDLAEQLKELGTPLVLLKGNPIECFTRLVNELNPSRVYYNRCFEPQLRKDEQQLESFLGDKGVEVCISNSIILVEPQKVLNQKGEPYKVYSAFARAWSNFPIDTPPRYLKPDCERHEISGLSIGELELISTDSPCEDFHNYHDPTRKGAEKALEEFVTNRMSDYPESRDIPSIEGTSKLSAALHWGQIGPREIVHKVSRCHDSSGKRKFLSELAWREFAYYILYHFPHTVFDPFRPEFKDFAWSEDGPELEPWKMGETGYPMIDAGMRELATTGYMHNRVRMLVASLLVKHLMISWKAGAQWFWEHLVDADLANNTLGWQWTAGCGVDAAPYFRIFNPVTQGKKFDKGGTYIRRHVAELKQVPDKHIHEPWLMTADEQQRYGCVVGKDYPEPICGLMEGRIRALSAWKTFNNPPSDT